MSAQWNWSALAQQAVATNTSQAESKQQHVRDQVKQAAALARRPSQRNAPPPGRSNSNTSSNSSSKLGAATATPVVAAPPSSKGAIAIAAAEKGVEVEAFSRLRIQDRTVSATELATEMTGRRYIALRDMDSVAPSVLTDDTVDWVTIGVLVRKTMSKATAKGDSFMVWALSDLEATELGVFLFGSAYDAHWRELEGTIVAVLNAGMLPASEKKQFALKVAKAEEVVKLGRAKDFGICKGMNSADARCRLAVNTAKSQRCLHHIASSFMAAGKRRQQLNNSFATFNQKSLFSSKGQLKNISAGVYGAQPPKGARGSGAAAAVIGGASGWNPLITKKRKRAEQAVYGREHRAMVGISTVLSDNGTVAQHRAKPLKTTTATASSATLPAAAIPAGVGSKTMTSRSQKIIASLAAAKGKGGAVYRPTKVKKVDMIKFMNAGAP